MPAASQGMPVMADALFNFDKMPLTHALVFLISIYTPLYSLKDFRWRSRLLSPCFKRWNGWLTE